MTVEAAPAGYAPRVETILSVERVSKEFGGLRAVNDVSVDLPVGSIASIIGPNGAGKSTVINLLSGFHTPTGGRVLLGGEDITGQPPHELTKAGLVRTFQNGRLFKRLSVFENVSLGNTNRATAGMFDIVFRTSRFRKEELDVEQRARGYLKEFNLHDEAYRLVNELPYGKQRQIEIVRALVGMPNILLLDEPRRDLTAPSGTISRSIYAVFGRAE